MTLRYALRSLAKSPGFAAIAVVALGVGLGLSTTMFAVLDAVTHPYVAYQEPENLFSITWWFGRRNPMQPVELYRFFRDETRSFAAVLPVARFDRVTARLPAGQEELGVSRVTPRYFGVTGVRVAAGRAFVESDGEQVAIVSHELWRRLYGKRRDVTGAAITLGEHIYPIVGVMPRGMSGPALWLPLPASFEAGASTAAYARPLVRLRPGITRAQADAELKALARLLTERFAAQDAPFAFELVPVVEPREELRDIHKAMAGSALLVLLIACVNLAHLMLARGMAKRRELALRMALGAPRAAVVRQMFAECAILTVGGALLGAVITVWGADLLRNRMPPEVAWVGLVQPQLSWRVFALSAGAAGLSAVLFGLLPALRVAFDVNVVEPLKDDTGTVTGKVRQRYSPLVVSEVALALVLMMGAGLLLRTVQQLRREAEGFNSRTLYRAFMIGPRLADTAAAAQRRADMFTTLRGAEGVTAVALSTYRRPPGGNLTAERYDDSIRTITTISYQVVSSDYLRVLGLPMLRGRDFEPGDAATGGVAIVDPVAAQRLYPNQNPVGRMLKLGGPAANAPWVPIVGVVRSASVLESRNRDVSWPAVYVSGADLETRGNLIIRTAVADPRTPARLQAHIRSSTGAAAYVIPFDYEQQAELASRGFLAKVFVTMGAVALGLAALGLYGVLAYAVNRRMREFAVRIALGAEPGMLWRLVVHDGFVMLLAGTGVGAFGALAAARMLDAVLVAVLPSDVVSLVACEAVLLATGFAALIQPARRAARANPLDILRAV